MKAPTLKIDRQEFVLVPKAEYDRWRRESPPSKRTRRPKKPSIEPVEMYSDERVAEFLLTNTADAADYARACKLVKKMGLDPAKIDHDKPIGVA